MRLPCDDWQMNACLNFMHDMSYGYIEGYSAGNSVSASKAGQAKRQHRELYLHLHEISESAEEAQYRGTIVQDYQALVVACKEFLAVLEAHEKLESDLIRHEFGIGRFGS